jgi:PAS domain-containing protein
MRAKESKDRSATEFASASIALKNSRDQRDPSRFFAANEMGRKQLIRSADPRFATSSASPSAAREGRFEGEGWRVRKDGSQFWASVVLDVIRDPAGRTVGYAKITRDLTERRLAEETLRRSEERFRILIQGVTHYSIYMLDPQGFVSSWNAGAERLRAISLRKSRVSTSHASTRQLRRRMWADRGKRRTGKPPHSTPRRRHERTISWTGSSCATFLLKFQHLSIAANAADWVRSRWTNKSVGERSSGQFYRWKFLRVGKQS